MASPSPVPGPTAQPPGGRSRDSLATSLGKSYGTVKDATQNMSSSYRSVITHDVVNEDTLQGLALKYDTTVQDIRRANNLWASESVHSRLVLKIPLSLGECGSHNNSPKISRSPKVQSKHSSSVDHLPTVVTSNGTSSKKFDEHDEEVRSKPRKRNVSSSASCSAVGVKSIADILNSADEQLKLSREFADKMAIRSATLSLPPDSYNRLPQVSVSELSSLQPLQQDDTSPSRRTFKIPSMSSEKVSASREQVEDDIFEL